MITTFSGAAAQRTDAGKFSEPVPAPVVRLTDVARLADEREQVVRRPRPEDLPARTATEGRAAQVRDQDMEVVGVEPRLLGLAEGGTRVVEGDPPARRRRPGSRRWSRRAARPGDLLPGRRDRPG
jgi:hypothetical protein